MIRGHDSGYDSGYDSHNSSIMPFLKMHMLKKTAIYFTTFEKCIKNVFKSHITNIIYNILHIKLYISHDIYI